MTVPFYSQEELDAAIAKERRLICAWIASDDGPAFRNDIAEKYAIERIDAGDYPRPLVVEVKP